MHCAQVCPSGFASCNILCFAMDTVKNINGLPCIETLGNPRELGEYFIAIDDIDQFLKRVVCAVAAQGAEYIFSPVAYGPPALAPGRDLGNHILLEMDEAPGDAFFPDGLPGDLFRAVQKGGAIRVAKRVENCALPWGCGRDPIRLGYRGHKGHRSRTAIRWPVHRRRDRRAQYGSVDLCPDRRKHLKGRADPALLRVGESEG